MSPRRRIPRLAVTGGIGSGKSTAVAYLSELGAATLSADDLVHEILDETTITGRVARRHGDAIVRGGVVDRAALAGVVFDDPAELDWLEGVIHPQVRQRVRGWIREQQQLPRRPPLLVVEIPLLFESGMEGEFDRVLLVTASEALRRRRLAAKMTASQFAGRAARQADEAEKAAHSDFVIDNSTSRRWLKERVAEVYAQILADLAAERRAPAPPG